MTSTDSIFSHQPDTFLKSRDYMSSEALESERQSLILALKTRILKDSICSERVLQFIHENSRQDLKLENNKTFKPTVDGTEILYSRDPDKIDPTGQALISNEDWYNVPFWAVEKSRKDILDICFRTGVNIGQLFLNNWKTILVYAVSLPSVKEEIVTFLLNYVDVNSDEISRNTAICACLNNQLMHHCNKLQLVKLLLRAGTRTGTTGGKQRSPLHSYVLSITNGFHLDENWTEIIDVLVHASGDVDERDFWGQSSLMLAIGFSGQNDSSSTVQVNLEIIQYLLEKGADPNFVDNVGHNCFHLAASCGSLHTLKLIRMYGSMTMAQNKLGMTPIYSACDYSDDEDVEEDRLFAIIQELIDAGCDINSKAIDQSTVLHCAASHHPSNVIHFLCERGANVNSLDYLQRTPLHMASGNVHPGIVQCLAKFSADLNATDINNDTPLHHACLQNNLQVASALLELGANAEATGDLGIRPIHLAAESADSDLMNVLVRYVCLDSTDMWGATPLHYAASDGNLETVEVLLQLGADKIKRDTCDMTPLDYALYRGSSLKTAQLLSSDDSVVKFGNLPPLYFPNRPVIKQENVGAYFDGLIDAFSSVGNMGLPLAQCLLHSPGLGHVDLHNGEAKAISDKVVSIMERIVKRIGELDNTFEAKLLRAGSTMEGVKTGFPDEFDFLCEIVKFSHYIERTDSSEAAGFARVVMRKDSPQDVLKYCLLSQRVIDASHFLQRFKQLALQAKFDIFTEHNSQIYTGSMSVTDMFNIFEPLFCHNDTLYRQEMTFRGKDHKLLDISVDLNPVLFSTVLPEEYIQTCHLLGDISSSGIYLIPKECKQIQTLPETVNLWRYSTHHIEAEIMQSIPQIGRECYILCKLLRMEPMTCGMEYLQYNRLEMTNEQIDTLYPESVVSEDAEDDSDVHDGMFNNDDREENEDDGSGSVAVAECVGNDKEDYDTASNENMLYNDEKSEMCGMLDNKESINDATDMQPLGCKDEMSAERAIPSYYLKSIFIKECERLLIEGGHFDEECLTTIPWRVYSYLLKACEENELTTLFLPTHNMLQHEVKSMDILEINQVRIMYCKNILRLMENLDLKE